VFTYYERRSYYQEGKTLFELAIVKLSVLPGGGTRDMLLIQLKGRLGAYEQLLGNYGRSEELLRKCLEMSDKSPLHEDVMYARVQLGHLLYRQGKFAEAIKNGEDLLQHEQEIKDRSLVSSIKNTLGNVYFRQDDNEKALDFYKDCESISIAMDDPYKITNALNSIGNVYLRTKKYEEAQEYYQRSLKLAKQIKNKKMTGIILNNLGNLARHQGNYDEAFRCIEESLAVKQDVGEPVSIGFTYSVLGFTSLDRDELDRALRNFRKALELLIPRKAMYYILNTFPSLSKIAHDKQRYDWAAKIMVFARDHLQVTETIKKIMVDDLAKLEKESPKINIQRLQKELEKKGEDKFFSELLDFLSAA
jgi:tetratricopeptide (TPR) repeat protein